MGSNSDVLSNVEFLQFDDTKVRTSDLATVRSISAIDASVEEGDIDKTITFAISLDNAATTEVTVDFETISGSAISGSDSVDAAGTLTYQRRRNVHH